MTKDELVIQLKQSKQFIEEQRLKRTSGQLDIEYDEAIEDFGRDMEKVNEALQEVFPGWRLGWYTPIKGQIELQPISALQHISGNTVSVARIMKDHDVHGVFIQDINNFDHIVHPRNKGDYKNYTTFHLTIRVLTSAMPKLMDMNSL